MVLSSQQSRPVGGRSSYMYARRRQRSRGWIAVVIVAILIAVPAYIYWPRGDDRDANGAIDGTGADARLAANTETGDSSRADPRSVGGTNNRTPAPGTDRYGNNTVGQPGDPGNAINNNPEPQEQPQQTPGKQNNGVITMGERVDDNPQESGQETGQNTNSDPSRRTNTGDPHDTPPRGTVDPPVNTAPPVVPTSAPAELSILLTQAEDLAARNELVRARELYNQALYHPQVGQAAPAIRRIMAGINDTLLFSNKVIETDPYTESHRVASGELLSTIAARCRVDWLLLAQINGIADPSKMPAGKTIKIINGPFHAVVDKGDHRMDLYVGEPNQLGQQMYVRSFPIGLGEYGSTPVGEWVVREGNKLVDPSWRDERTGEFFAGNDPNNPIGKRWIGLRGLDDNTKDLEGYGIHGTIDPDSIGKDMSRGCIRMLSEDVELVFKLLSEGRSMVLIRD